MLSSNQSQQLCAHTRPNARKQRALHRACRLDPLISCLHPYIDSHFVALLLIAAAFPPIVFAAAAPFPFANATFVVVVEEPAAALSALVFLVGGASSSSKARRALRRLLLFACAPFILRVCKGERETNAVIEGCGLLLRTTSVREGARQTGCGDVADSNGLLHPE